MGARDLARASTFVLAGAAFYEALAALGVIPLGSVPGEAPRGERVVTPAAVFALLIGAGSSFANGSRGRTDTSPVWTVLPLAGAAFVVARFLSFDPYYAPTERRASDDGLVSPWLVVGLVAAAVAAGVLTRASPRVGMIASAATSILCALVAWATRLGH